jgi:hypothetical protein
MASQRPKTRPPRREKLEEVFKTCNRKTSGKHRNRKDKRTTQGKLAKELFKELKGD